MKRFIYVDHYIGAEDLGHHLPYAEMILKAVTEKGWETVLITNANFDLKGAAAQCITRAGTHIVPAYHLDFQTTPVLDYYNRHIPRGIYQILQIEWLKKLVKAIYFNLSGIDRVGVRAAKQFKRDTVRVFDEIQLGEGDRVFFSYAQEDEAASIIQLICDHQIPNQAAYHLQLWKEIFDQIGESYTFDHPAATKIRKDFRKYLRNPSRAKIHFYTDSVERSAQHAFVLGQPVKTLPLPPNLKPVSPDYPGHLPEAPLKIITPGSPRIEKGFLLMPDIVGALWEKRIATGQACFELQVNNIFNKWDPVVNAIDRLKSHPAPGVRLLDQHMSGEEYANYLSRADICLLPYQRENYYARTSGPFSEAISVGMPVVVPNISWMSRQLKEATYQYLNEGANTSGPPAHQYLFSKSQGNTASQAAIGPVPVSGSICLIRLLLPPGALPQCLKVTITTHDREENCLGTHLKYAETSTRQPTMLQVRVAPDAVNIYVKISSFLETESPLLESAAIFFAAQKDMPSGVVGLFYDHEDEIPALLDEMIDHYEHYRRTALEFSRNWNAVHNPQALADLILGEAQTQ